MLSCGQPARPPAANTPAAEQPVTPHPANGPDQATHAPGEIHGPRVAPRATDRPPAATAAARDSRDVLTPRELPGLHNVISLPGGLISGSEPHGAKGFATLASLGVRTIISVDGAAPDVAAAEALGLRYVHLPIGYDGIDPNRCVSLAKAARDLPGPAYIHCHHGLHRGPAAAACILVGLGHMNVTQAIELMHVAGTSAKYAGLFEVVKNSSPLPAETLDEAPADFPSRAIVPGFTGQMAALGRTWDRLKEIRAAAWRQPEHNPDLDPVNEAVILAEAFAELRRLPEISGRPAAFVEMLKQAKEAAWGLSQARDAAAREAAYQLVSQRCGDCHREYRDR